MGEDSEHTHNLAVLDEALTWCFQLTLPY